MVRILVADPCELGRRYATELLQYDGHLVLEAEDFEAMVAVLLYAAVDTLLLDPLLPGLTEEGLQHFLRGPRSLGPTVFLLGEGPAARLRAEADRLGAEGAFVKGEEAVELVQAVCDSMTQRRRADGRDDSRLDPWPLSEAPHRPWDHGGSIL